MSAFNYNYAIVSRIPNSFKYSGQQYSNKYEKESEIDVEKAREEHRQLIETLKKCEVRVIELQEEEDYPECCFVDDCAVVIGATALITRLGQTTRQGEVSFSFRGWRRIRDTPHPHLLCDSYCGMFTLDLE